MIIDTHAHLNWESYKNDLDQVLNRAKEVGVTQIINVGVDLKSSQEVVDQTSSIKDISTFATIGIHPHEAHNFQNPHDLALAMEKLGAIYTTNPTKVVAIGECGLDYYFSGNTDFIPSELSTEELIKLQKKLYLAQINLAKSTKLPLVIHCRNSKPETDLPLAWNDIFISDLQGSKGVFHNFSGTEEDAKIALDLGFYLSFSCVVTYPKNEYLRELIKKLPFDKIVTETDCPFLPPQQIRGQRNEPANVSEVVKVIAEAREVSYQEVAEQTFINAKKLFLDRPS